MFHIFLQGVTDYPHKAASGLQLRMHFPSVSIHDLQPIFIKGEL